MGQAIDLNLFGIPPS